MTEYYSIPTKPILLSRRAKQDDPIYYQGEEYFVTSITTDHDALKEYYNLIKMSGAGHREAFAYIPTCEMCGEEITEDEDICSKCAESLGWKVREAQGRSHEYVITMRVVLRRSRDGGPRQLATAIETKLKRDTDYREAEVVLVESTSKV